LQLAADREDAAASKKRTFNNLLSAFEHNSPHVRSQLLAEDVLFSGSRDRETWKELQLTADREAGKSPMTTYGHLLPAYYPRNAHTPAQQLADEFRISKWYEATTYKDMVLAAEREESAMAKEMADRRRLAIEHSPARKPEGLEQWERSRGSSRQGPRRSIQAQAFQEPRVGSAKSTGSVSRSDPASPAASTEVRAPSVESFGHMSLEEPIARGVQSNRSTPSPPVPEIEDGEIRMFDGIEHSWTGSGWSPMGRSLGGNQGRQ